MTLALLLACLLGGSASAGTNAPAWLRDLAAMPVGTYPDDTPGVQLLDEQVVTVTEKGEFRTLYRQAFRILRTSGRGLGKAVVHFDEETKISNLRAWCIPAKGAEYEIKDKDAIEAKSFSGGALYDDERIKVLEIPESEPGSVVGYEYEQKQRPYVMQDIWGFQSGLPVKISRYTLNLSPGWEVQTTWKNYAAKEPVVSGNQYRWELTDIPALQTKETNHPALRGFAGRMALNFFSSGQKTGAMLRSWNDIGLWYKGLVADRRNTTPAMSAKVVELTAGKKDQIERIRALAAFAQRDVRYVAIEIGIGGFQPHFAAAVFDNRYGDCKDKVTVLSTLLKEIGVESHYVIAQTKRGIVAPDFPYYGSFNHAIIAIHLPDGVKTEAFAAVVRHPKYGNLLYFDPTDSITPLGLIPDSLQSNRGLLVTQDGGELVDLPLQPPQANQLVRTGKLRLGPDGTLRGEVREVRTGSSATWSRAALLNLEAPDRVKWMERFLSSFLNTFTLKDFKIEGLEDYDKELVTTFSFEAPNYAKPVGGLLLVRPRVFGTKSGDNFDLKDRRFPVEIDAATLQTDEFQITLPDGFTVDELPEPINVSSAPASYSSEAKSENNVLRYRREYKVEQVMIPLEELKELKQVYNLISADERNSAVLKKAQ